MEKNETQYFEGLLTKVREIRSSERSAAAKIADVVALAIDYNSATASKLLTSYMRQLKEQEAIERFANKLMFFAELKAATRQEMTMESIELMAITFLHKDIKLDSFNNPSFNGVFEEIEEGGQVCLPEELKDFKGSSMVLKVEGMDRLIDTYCSRNTFYRRAYAILDDLDKQLLECVDKGVFPEWVYIPYKDGGDAIFQFSRFEVDLKEPDERYRTLYVVYRYDTTAS
jgi:hypothetical protein